MSNFQMRFKIIGQLFNLPERLGFRKHRMNNQKGHLEKGYFWDKPHFTFQVLELGVEDSAYH